MRKLSLVALLLTVLSSAFASEKGDITVISDSSAVFRVYYSKPNVSKVKVSIYNESGQKVFGETIRNREGFVRPYNMKELPAGVYTFEIEDENETKRFEYTYADKSFRTTGSSLIVSVKKLDADKFLLALGNAKNEEVKIEILNEKNELLYSAAELVENQFAQLYNLQSISSRKLTFKIFNKAGEVEEFIF
ncbi:MAG: T9SS type A sorting domain-containing protein [Bacteroidota bacterium]